MHILVIGGAGFIGSHIVEYNLKKGNQVHVVDDLSTGSMDNLSPFLENPDFRFDQANIITWSGIEKAVAWADHIFYMAAVVGVMIAIEEPVKVLVTNIAGCERLLWAVRSGGWNTNIIIASSSEVYGSGIEEEFREEDDLIIPSKAKMRWNSAISKIADEALSLSYAGRYNMHITIARIFNTIGPRQTGHYGAVVPRFVEQAVGGSPITVFGDGSQKRCFCDVRDTVEALDMLAANPASKGEIVNIGNAREISIRALAELVRERAGSDSRIVNLPYEEVYGEGFEEIPCRKPALKKLYNLTNFKHRWKLEETIDELINASTAISYRAHK
jgi:UDP-glucose 4-epimerase